MVSVAIPDLPVEPLSDPTRGNETLEEVVSSPFNHILRIGQLTYEEYSSMSSTSFTFLRLVPAAE